MALSFVPFAVLPVANEDKSIRHQDYPSMDKECDQFEKKQLTPSIKDFSEPFPQNLSQSPSAIDLPLS
ncbi:unnamed protein product [Protopolystoma xenopodis]|uniref:Uncharacterized protein n=1 Tax=Protopolystoma xenopodis TaxID=117903 RepID=A0A448WW54_9PLAT|nr:unnamed protein product [Protopolystoma xenopodis]